MSYDYDQYITQLANMMPTSTDDASFVIMVPFAIDYAEQRIYRELDLVAATITDATGSLTAATRTVNLSTTYGTFLVVDDANVLVGSTNPNTATRYPMQMTTTNYINTVYPSATTGSTIPQVMAMLSNTTLLIGPPPDQAYTLEVTGTQRPTPLSSGNTTTILTTMLPDLFFAASMIYVSGFMRNFGAQGDDPQTSVSWEGQYTKLSQSANVEEMRKSYQSAAWTSQSPTPIATPPRV